MDWKIETRRVLEEIRRLIKQSDLNQRKIEERAGFSRGYLSQLFAENITLKVWHVLAILKVLDQSPADFFCRLYPSKRLHALEQFRLSSEPMSQELDSKLGRLYNFGVSSLQNFRQRLERCEGAIGQLEAKGLVTLPQKKR